MPSIPEEYGNFWVPYKPAGVLYHLTTAENYAKIVEQGFIKPRDPAPKHWAGMVAVFMADPTDSLYEKTLADVLAHVKAKHEKVVRLHLELDQPLFRSTDLPRTFQVASLTPISAEHIVKVEEL